MEILLFFLNDRLFSCFFYIFIPFYLTNVIGNKSKFYQEDVVKSKFSQKYFFKWFESNVFNFFPDHTGKTVYIFALKLSVEMF